VTTDALDGDLRPGFVRVKTYGDTLRDYLANPEAKSLGPGGEPVRADSVGLLRRRPVSGIQPIRRIGKEANHLDERTWGLETDASRYLTEYVDPAQTEWSHLVLEVLKTMDIESLAIASGLHRRSLERLLKQTVRPRKKHEIILSALALQHAHLWLSEVGIRPPLSPPVAMSLYLATYQKELSSCLWCGTSLERRQRLWCSDRCRIRARSTRHWSERSEG
jgi:hypothetical protein